MSQNIYVDRTLQFNKGGGGTPKIIMDADDSANILYILPATDATETICFGNATKNLDVTFYGGTSGTSLLWDESLDKLLLTAVWSTAGLTGRPLEVSLTTTAALGSYVNAIKGYVNLSTGGSSSGLFSVFNGEMNMATTAGTPGHYAIYEAEITCPTSWTGANDVFFLWLQASGNTVTNFDTYGNLFNLKGLTSGSGSMLYGNTIRFQLADVAKYLMYGDAEFGCNIGTSGTPITTTYSGAKAMSVYTTCASTNTGTSHEPVLFNTVMTGAGQVGGRVKVNMSTNVALGAWANALKAQVECNTSGRATGLLSAFCAELVLPASNVSALSGSYAPLELELNCAETNTPSWRTSFAYMKAGGNSTAVTAFNAVGSLFDINGLGTASSATNLFHTTGTVSATHGLRIRIDDVSYYILLKASPYE